MEATPPAHDGARRRYVSQLVARRAMDLFRLGPERQPANLEDAVGGRAAVRVTTKGGFEGFESPDGKYFYYAKGRDVPGIWRTPVDGGVETLVVDHHGAGFWRSWAVTEEGVYFVTAEMPARPIIEFFSFATGDVRQVAILDRPVHPRIWGFSVSPDRRWILYTQTDQSSSDIMLMEKFR